MLHAKVQRLGVVVVAMGLGPQHPHTRGVFGLSPIVGAVSDPLLPLLDLCV